MQLAQGHFWGRQIPQQQGNNPSFWEGLVHIILHILFIAEKPIAIKEKTRLIKRMPVIGPFTGG